MTTPKVHIENLYSQYPFVGTITEWNPDRGFGKIRDGISNDRPCKSYFAHFSGYRGPQDKRCISRVDLSGKQCLFAVGVSPHKYDPNKRPNRSVLMWMLVEDISESIDSYDELREAAISQWERNDLFHALKADWYINIWKNHKKSYFFPDVKLDIINDKILDRSARDYENGLKNFQDWQTWLDLKLSSPMFAVNQSQRNILKDNLLTMLEFKEAYFFQDTSADSLLNFYLNHQDHFGESWFWDKFSYVASQPTRQELAQIAKKLPKSLESFNFLSEIQINSAIAIDTESNDIDIYQLGWWKSGQGYLEDRLDSPSAVKQCLETIETQLRDEDIQWLVGHNVIKWDLPVLHRLHESFLSTLEVWDTLLVGWILEPWKKSHALVVKENAHQADVDAKAAVEKLQEQLQKFPQRFLENQCLKPQNPIDAISDEFEILDDVIGRNYPSLVARQEKLLGKVVIAPKWRIISDWAWRPSVSHCHGSTMSLDAQQLIKKSHNDPKNYALKAIACVVAHAKRHNVQVTPEMLPFWLKEQAGKIIEQCIAEPSTLENTDGQKYIRVTTYENIHDNPDAAATDFQLFHPEEGCLTELSTFAAQNSLQSHEVLGKQGEFLDSYALFRIADSSVNLEGIKNLDLERQSLWLEYVPALSRQEAGKPWRAYRHWQQTALPSQLKPKGENAKPDENLSVVLPHYSGNSPILCTSKNRSLYWRDTLLRFLAFIHTSNNDSIPVLLVAHQHEVEPLRIVLEELNQTRIRQNRHTILRYLEHLHNSGKRLSCRYCAVDHQSNAHAWLEASQELGYSVRLVFDSLPLYEWWMQIAPTENDLEDLGETDNSILENQSEDETTPSIDEEEDLDPNSGTSLHLAEPSTRSSSKQISRVHLSPSHIQACIEYGLSPWLRVVLRRDKENMPEVTVLDARCHPSSFRNVCSTYQPFSVDLLPKQPVDQTTLLDKLRKELGDIERQDAPADYENYEKFLKTHWGYNSFRESQTAALKAIITNQQDVLVRLPTGEGKSILFHIPALLRGSYTQRLTIVLTPLKALMADQVLNLWGRGFIEAVDYLSSDRAPWEMDEVYQGIVDNRIKLLFVAPERFRVNRFREAIDSRYQNDQGFEYIVVDEAHCVSQWGFEFRPDYLYAMEQIKKYYRSPCSDGQRTPILLFSATVTKAVQTSLEDIIGIQEEDRDKTYTVQPSDSDLSGPIQKFIELKVERVTDAAYGREANLEGRSGFVEKALKEIDSNISSAIIFTTRRSHAEDLASTLDYEDIRDINSKAIKLKHFHAGLPAETRAEIYENFKDRRINALVSTKAFGMGMDIPHIHSCIHLTPPSSLEDYLQEVGRVGRSPEEREKAEISTIECKLLYADDDFATNHGQIQSSRVTQPILISLWKEILNTKKAIPGRNQKICVVPTDGFGEIKNENILRNAIFWLEKLERISLKGQFGKLLKVKLNQQSLERVSRQDTETQPIAQLLLVLYTNSGLLANIEEYQAVRGNTTLDKPSNINFDARRALVGFLVQSSEEENKNNFLGLVSEPWDEAELNLDTILEVLGASSIGEVFGLLFRLGKSGCLQIIQEIEFMPGKFLDQKDQMLSCLDYIYREILNFHNPDQGIPLSTLEQYFDEQKKDIPKENWSDNKQEKARRLIIQSAAKLLRAAGARTQQVTNEEENLLLVTVKDAKKLAQRIDVFRESLKKILAILEHKTVITLDDLWQGKLPLKPQDITGLKAVLRLLSSLGLYNASQDLTSRSYLLEISHPERCQAIEATDFSDKEEVLAELEEVNTFAILRSYTMALYAKLPDSKARITFIENYFKASTPGELVILIEEMVKCNSNEDERLQDLIDQVKEEAINKLTGNLKKNPQQDIACNYPYHQHVLVNAGPGAGKTHVLVSRCVILIHKQKLQPQDILILAFNRAVVHEIKSRVRKIFSELGYGTYVRRLKVFTFHSLAKIHMADSLDKNEEIGDILQKFSQRLKTDSKFREKVTAGYKSILVDEFQDMTQNFFDVIMEIQKTSGAGLMVIGDDDQDILLWQRKNNKEVHLSSNYYFEKFQITLKPEVLNLTFNYRSAPEIVAHSQRWIDSWLGKERRKAELLLEANPFASGVVNEFSPDTMASMLREKLLPSKEVAVLCRTNSEVSDLYERLKFLEDNNLCRIRIKQDNGLWLSQTREIAEWLDICKCRLDSGDNKIYGDQPPDDLISAYDELPLPDKTSAYEMINHLWDISYQSFGRLTLKSHVEQLKELKLSEASRLIQQREDNKAILTVSTINSVKGLEFDVVFIYPSKAAFPFGFGWDFEEENISYASLEEIAREEKKLYYVAATRARQELYYSLGEREKSWSKDISYPGVNNSFMLNGTLGEIKISWAGYANQNKIQSGRYKYVGTQEYIRTRVKISDPLRLCSDSHGRIGIAHNNHWIAILEEKTAEKVKALYHKGYSLRVSAIYRYPVTEQDIAKENPPYWTYFNKVKAQRWLYTVLVSGRIGAT